MKRHPSASFLHGSMNRFALVLFALAVLSAPLAAAPERCIVVDAGHGGAQDVDESSANNATSATGIPEKDLTLEVARAVFDAIKNSEAAKRAGIVPVMTRERDVNVGMGERAKIALGRETRAFVSIHFNASTTHTARGPLGMVQSAEHGNLHLARDAAFAELLAKTVSTVTRRVDPKSLPHDFLTDRELKGGRGSFLFRYLRAEPRGQTFPACFLEIEFIDNPAVDAWLVRGEKARTVRQEIAAAIAAALVDYVAAQK
jgi:N-acetylmuramoyl-L-alanine amidase